ncbi:unnamed protein product [Brassica oleracea var. botrytis]
MVLKDSIEEMFPKWPGEPDDPQLVSLITVIHGFKQKKVKTQNEVNNIEGKLLQRERVLARRKVAKIWRTKRL